MRKWLVMAGALGMLFVGPLAFADVWDTSSTDDDDSSSTDNEFIHGSVQVHDLAADAAVADQDWYKVTTFAYSSHEVVMEGVTGDIANGQSLDRVDGAATVLTSGGALPGGSGYSLSLRWQNTTASTVAEYVRVGEAQCTTTCTSLDQYTVRYRETTASIARFNNAGSQITVLMLQNPATYSISGTIYFWSTTGTLAASAGFSIGAKQLIVYNTAGSAPGVGGSITIAHNGRYGDLQGKAVAVEPSTGFSFDTPMTYKPH